jgi:hypothetical protein
MGCPYQTDKKMCMAVRGEVVEITPGTVEPAPSSCPNLDVNCPYVNELLDEIEKLKRSCKFTQEWYAQRWETLKDWARDHGHTEVFSILANGIPTPQDPPTYAQQMNILKHGLKAAEAKIATVRKKIEDLRDLYGTQPLLRHQKKDMELILDIIDGTEKKES